MKLLQEPSGPTISPSALKSFMSCPRKWGFDRLDKIPREETDSQRLGTRVHKILEEYLRLGIVPDEDELLMTSKGLRYPGLIARAGLPLLPVGPVKVEEEFFLDVEGVCLHGFIDFRTSQIVGDHKTTTDLKWALTPEQISNDQQGIIYGAVAVADGSKAPLLKWIYYRTTKTPEAVATTATMTSGEIEDKLGDIILPPAREMIKALHECASARELEPKLDQCGRYGGCPYRALCDIKPMESFLMNISEFIAKQTSTTTAPAAPLNVPEVPDVPAVPEVVMNPLPFAAEDLDTWSRAQLKARAMELGLVDASSKLGVEALKRMIREREEEIKQKVEKMTEDGGFIEVAPGVVEKVPRAVAFEVKSFDAEGQEISRIISAHEGAPGILVSDEPVEAYSSIKVVDLPEVPGITVSFVPDIPVVPTYLEDLPEVLKEIEPPSAAVHEDHGMTITQLEGPEINVPQIPTAVDEIPDDEEDEETFAIGTLYIDCLPVGVKVERLSPYIAKVHDLLGYEEDYRLLEENAYGKGAGRLAQEVLKLVWQEEREINLVASSRLPEHRDCLSALEGVARFVVKGV